ncbi:Elongation factor G [bacterium HR17]|uniref:Elongation factor G n=1 Tax=Candidatus Fervidibacter japonicus TaxID=2035412 RepID=A0A2H5XDP0_9BACT|nr:Elongation factor G [bacterium HR17]
MVMVPQRIRNVALLGAPGAGKTSLGDTILWVAGAVSRRGSVDQGSSVFDHEEEAKSRHHSVSLSLGHCVWNEHWINIVDTPGLLDFFGDAYAAVRVVEGAILVIDGTVGVEAQVERSFRLLRRHRLPCVAFINKVDDERADFDKVLSDIESHLQVHPLPLWVPLRASSVAVTHVLSGAVDDGERITAGQGGTVAVADQWRERLAEAVAETDDELLEKYLAEGTLSDAEVLSGLRQVVAAQAQNLLVFAGSAVKGLGVRPLLDAIVSLFPSPLDIAVPVQSEGQTTPLKPQPNGPGVAFVFKLFADPYVGRVTVLRVFSGVIRSDSTVTNVNAGRKERIGQLLVAQGKTYEPVGEAPAGAIVLVGKLESTRTGHTLCSDNANIQLPPIEFPRGYMELAVYPKSQGDEEKILSGIQRLAEEDGVFRWYRHPETGETIIVGMGDQHLEVIVEKLRRKFGAQVETRLPKIPYKETVRKPGEGEGRYIKQTGGRGQYGVARIRVEPLERGAGFEFVNQITGGVIPSKFIPSVEKGVREALQKGVLAGYPMVDLRVILYDGKHHEVDSSDFAFQMAGALALRSAAEKCDPYLLEPIMKLEVWAPEEFVGEIIGDLNGKRGHVLGIEAEDGLRKITAMVPLAEIQRYAADLRSLTRGRGTYRVEFSHYEEVPPHISAQIIARAKAEQGKE